MPAIAVLADHCRFERALRDRNKLGLVFVVRRLVLSFHAVGLPVDERELHFDVHRLCRGSLVSPDCDNFERQCFTFVQQRTKAAETQVEVGTVLREASRGRDRLLIDVRHLAENAHCARLRRFGV